MEHINSRAPANNMIPYWQLPNGTPNVNYHTVPYNYSAQVNWEQHTAAQRMQRRSLQHAQQQNTYTPTTHPHSNIYPSSPAMLYPPTPPTEHGPRDLSSKSTHLVPLEPNPARIESPQSLSHSDPSPKTTEYGKMSAMKTAILDLAPALYAQRFQAEHVCIFSVVTARKNPGGKIGVALIAYLEENRSRWVSVTPSNKYYDTLREATEALLFGMEEMMGSLLDSGCDEVLVPGLDGDEEAFIASLVNLDEGGEVESGSDKGE